MRTGDVTSQPIGHYEFCQSYPGECAIRSRQAAPPRLSSAGWAMLDTVNRTVNAAILPRTDLDLYGREEVWSYPDQAGDCEDYVLLKRHMLLARGFAASNLLITVVRKANGEGHAVLTVRTASGEFVLDNLSDTVEDWRRTPYEFLKRQASFDTGRWVDISNGTATIVGSVR